MKLNVDMLDDRMIVDEILLRNSTVTQQYFYIKCYPLFKSIYDNYYTDCQTCMEFINEIYIHLMVPNENTGLCRLQTFAFSSTLTTWIKTVAVYYCYARYRRKQNVSQVGQIIESEDFLSDRFEQYAASVYEEDESPMNKEDLDIILNLMPNKRYSMIIRLHYLECMSHEEVAAILKMSMENYYNKHLRAKKQFNEILRKEERYGESL